MLKLSDLDCRKAKPKEKPAKLVDGGGLYLLVNTTGSKLWRYDYRFQGKRKTLAIGKYPDVSLAQARERHQEARALLAQDIDPAEKKQEAKQATKSANENTVKAVAEKWLELHASKVEASTARATRRLLEKDLFSYLGDKPISQVGKDDLLPVLQRLEDRGAGYSAHRLLEKCRHIWRMALADEVVERDITVTLRGLLKTYTVRHMPAITDPARLAELLRAIDVYTGSIITVTALKLAPMFFIRPGELRFAKWADIDLEAGVWSYTSSKKKIQHIVPLATQAISILGELSAITGTGMYVFPGRRSKSRPMSENTINTALRYMDFPSDEIVGHGFRATGRTILDEVLNYPPHIIEQQLTHTVKDPLGRAYNRTAHLPQRKAMMQAWADYLDKLKAGADVLPFKRKA